MSLIMLSAQSLPIPLAGVQRLMSQMSAFLAGLLFLFILPGPAWMNSTAPASIAGLFRNDFVVQPALSPDGKHLAALSFDENDRQNLFVINIDSLKTEWLTAPAGYDIYNFAWLDSQRIVFQLSTSQFYAEGLYVGRLGRLQRSQAIHTRDVTRIIGFPEKRPNHVLVLVGSMAEGRGRWGGLVEMNAQRALSPSARGANEGVLSRSYPLPSEGAVRRIYTDLTGEPYLSNVYYEGRGNLHLYESDKRQWRRLAVNLQRGTFLSADINRDLLWIVNHHHEHGYHLQRYHIYTGDWEEPVYADKSFDLGTANLVFSRKDEVLAGFMYTQRRLRNIWFHPLFATVQAIMDNQNPDTDNRLLSFDQSENRFLFHCGAAHQPGRLVVIDYAQRRVIPVSSVAPWLDEKRFFRTQPLEFTARDGLRLEGYLTLPDGASSANPVPLVVLVHGGPWVRDRWVFNREVQFLARLGYAVLQPNYRGSSGYAPEISHRDKYNFRLMHEDVTDSVNALLRTGLIQKDRVAIMGSSFGGYLALKGLVDEPGVYACGISICGVFDWEEQIRSMARSGLAGSYEFMSDVLGLPGQNQELFERISPLRRVENLQAPVLIAHGDSDRIVSARQSRELARQLSRLDKPHETFFRTWEGHGFFGYKNRVEFYELVEKFLQENL